MDKLNTEIIDISSYSRKLYFLWGAIGFGLAIAINILFNPSEIIVYGLILVFIFGAVSLVDYFVSKDKIILDFGNILTDKDKRFRLLDGTKTIDKFRIRNELNYDEKQILNVLKEFLEKNKLSQYEKIYLVGSNSPDNVQMVSDIINDKNL